MDVKHGSSALGCDWEAGASTVDLVVEHVAFPGASPTPAAHMLELVSSSGSLEQALPMLIQVATRQLEGQGTQANLTLEGMALAWPTHWRSWAPRAA